MEYTQEFLKNIQIELFYSQLKTLKELEEDLNTDYNVACNLACSEWEYTNVPTISGGRLGL